MARMAAGATPTRAEFALVRALADAPGVEQAVAGALAVIGQSFSWAVVELWLVDDEGSLLQHAGAWSPPAPELEEFRSQRRGCPSRRE